MSNDWTNPSGETGGPPSGWAAPGSPGPGASAPTPEPHQGGYPPPPQGAYPQQGAYPAPGQHAPGYPPPGFPSPGGLAAQAGYVPMAARPGVIPLRALTLSDVFEGTMRTIRGNPGATLGLALLVSTLFTLPGVALSLITANVDPGSDAMREVLTTLSVDGSNLLQSLGGLMLSGMLTVVLAEAVLGRRASIAQAWSKIKSRLLALIGTNLLTLLISLGPILLSAALIIVGAVGEADAAIALGGLSLFASIPVTIFLWVKLLFAPAVTVLERQGPITSVKRSWALTRHQWWRIFGISLLAYFLVMVVVMILTIPLTGLLFGVQGAMGESELGLVSMLALQAAGLVIGVLTTPFTAGVSGLLYLDQRIRKEALDVSLMAAAQRPE